MVEPFALLLICLAGWMNRNQQEMIEYFPEEIRLLKELLGNKPRFISQANRPTRTTLFSCLENHPPSRATWRIAKLLLLGSGCMTKFEYLNTTRSKVVVCQAKKEQFADAEISFKARAPVSASGAHQF